MAAANDDVSTPTLEFIRIPRISVRIRTTVSHWADHVAIAIADDDDAHSIETAPVEIPIAIDGGSSPGISKWHLRISPLHKRDGSSKYFIIWLHCDTFPGKEKGGFVSTAYALRIVNQALQDGKHDYLCNPNSNSVSCCSFLVEFVFILLLR